MTEITLRSGRSTVLLIDDSPVDTAVQSEILRSEHRVLSASGPESAMDLVRSGARPDIVLLDVMMPGTDGLAFCRRLKADPAAAGVPIIFVTAKQTVEDEEAGFAAGAVDYVAKPVDPHLLRARVRTHVQLKRARENLEQQNEALRESAQLREEVEQISRHDLKNPLMVIMNVPSFLRRQPNVTSDQRRWLQMIEDAARRLLEMINSSIDLFKMERGAYALSPVDVDALAVARRIAEAARLGSASEECVAIDLILEGSPATETDVFFIRGEELLLYSMLANLIKNAVEASAAGSAVSVSFDARGSQPGTAAIEVHNTGVIPQGIRGRFFEKFVTFGKKGGTGLGAYSARLAAITLGGSIAFTSSEESGTTVTVLLPRSEP